MTHEQRTATVRRIIEAGNSLTAEGITKQVEAIVNAWSDEVVETYRLTQERGHEITQAL